MTELKPVDSSNIDAIGYDPNSSELHVRFKGRDQVYIYEEVTQASFDALDRAESKGGFFAQHIKTSYKYRKA